MWETTPVTTQHDWEYSLSYANGLTVAGCDDWHIPNVNEILSLTNAEQQNTASWLNGHIEFSQILADEYWTSTRSYSLSGNAYAWVVDMETGFLFRRGPPNSATSCRWAVRSSGGGAVALPRTGKETKYRDGDDGDLECGAAWPVPRFIDCGDGIIADNLTGLMWEKNSDAAPKTWMGALAYAEDLTLGEHSDWRLPNRNEMRSLLNYEQNDIAEWLSRHGFRDIQDHEYWTSTTYAPNTACAWTVIMAAGHVQYADKTHSRFALAVRGGE
jgi:hypothetical protein